MLQDNTVHFFKVISIKAVGNKGMSQMKLVFSLPNEAFSVQVDMIHINNLLLMIIPSS